MTNIQVFSGPASSSTSAVRSCAAFGLKGADVPDCCTCMQAPQPTAAAAAVAVPQAPAQAPAPQQQQQQQAAPGFPMPGVVPHPGQAAGWLSA